MHKFLDKLSDEIAGIFAKAIGGLLLILVGVVVASIAGRPDVGLIAVVIGVPIVAFLLGVSVGKRTSAKRTAQMERDVSRGNLCVIGAFYGAKDEWKDVTDTANKRIKDGNYPFTVSNTNLMNGKDPYPYEPKYVLCVFKHKWTVVSAQFAEGQMFEFPPQPTP